MNTEWVVKDNAGIGFYVERKRKVSHNEVFGCTMHQYVGMDFIPNNYICGDERHFESEKAANKVADIMNMDLTCLREAYFNRGYAIHEAQEKVHNLKMELDAKNTDVDRLNSENGRLRKKNDKLEERVCFEESRADFHMKQEKQIKAMCSGQYYGSIPTILEWKRDSSIVAFDYETMEHNVIANMVNTCLDQMNKMVHPPIMVADFGEANKIKELQDQIECMKNRYQQEVDGYAYSLAQRDEDIGALREQVNDLVSKLETAKEMIDAIKKTCDRVSNDKHILESNQEVLLKENNVLANTASLKHSTAEALQTDLFNLQSKCDQMESVVAQLQNMFGFRIL